MASVRGGVYGWLDRQRFDVLGAIVGLVIAVGMLPIRLVVTNIYVVGIPVAIGIASGLYLLSVRNEDTESYPTLPLWAGRALPSVVLLGMALLVAIGFLQNGRSVIFYSLAILVGVALFAQILFVDDRDYAPLLVLAQVLALAFVIRIVALRTMPGYVGIDIWSHIPTYSASILEAGSLAPIADNKYYASPLFHLLIVGTSLLADLSVRSAAHVSIGLAMVLAIPFVYLAARLFVAPRWALFGAAVYAVSGYAVEWGIHLIPTTLGLVFFLAILYLLCRLLYVDTGLHTFTLLLVLSIATILTHQISSFIVLVMTGAGLLAHIALQFDLLAPRQNVSQVRSNARDSANLTGLLAFDLGFLTFMWSLTPHYGSTFLEIMFTFFYGSIVEAEGIFDPAGDREIDPDAPPLETTFVQDLVVYLDALAFLVPFLLTVVGCLFILRRRNVSHATFMCASAVVLMCVFVFAFPIAGVRTFVPSRWYAFMIAPMAVLGAIGIAHLSRTVRPAGVFAILLVLTLVLPGLAFAGSNGTIDQPAFEDTQTRYSYTASELAAVETGGEIITINETAGERIYTDHPYNTVFSRLGAAGAEAAQQGETTMAYDVIVHRDYLGDGAAFTQDEWGRAVTDDLSRDQLCGTDRHSAYDNGEVTMCVATWDTEAAAEELELEDEEEGPIDDGEP
ncbi:hypothetical protein [Natronorarus salvus]|uniref:hypothetical protein n=1 Tax=Natronorarus salvus TaxID=3117733 RepID=UPI002F26DEA4